MEISTAEIIISTSSPQKNSRKRCHKSGKEPNESAVDLKESSTKSKHKKKKHKKNYNQKSRTENTKMSWHSKAKAKQNKHADGPPEKTTAYISMFIQGPMEMKQLPTSGKFLAADEVLKEFSSNPSVYNYVPVGDKDNVYLFIDNYENFKKRSMNRRASYPDDCVWDGSQGTTVITTFIMSPEGFLKSVNLKDDLYCIESRSMGRKSVWKPLDPQPSPNDVIKMSRYYTKLKSNYNYKKRVTTIFYKNKFNNIALVEYCGTYKEGATSENSESEEIKAHLQNSPSVSDKGDMKEEIKR